MTEKEIRILNEVQRSRLAAMSFRLDPYYRERVERVFESLLKKVEDITTMEEATNE